MQKSIYILVVYYNNFDLFLANMQRIKNQNINNDIHFVIVTNSELNKLQKQKLHKLQNLFVIERSKYNLMEKIEKFIFGQCSVSTNHYYGIKALQNYSKKFINLNSYICFLDPDFIVLENNWINKLKNILEKDNYLSINTSWPKNELLKNHNSITAHFNFMKNKNFFKLNYCPNTFLRVIRKYLNKINKKIISKKSYDPGYKISIQNRLILTNMIFKYKLIKNKKSLITYNEHNIYYEEPIFCEDIDTANDIFYFQNKLFAIHPRSSSKFKRYPLMKKIILKIIKNELSV